MAGGASGGYEVQKSGMAGEARKLDDAGDDVGGIAKAVDSQMCYSADALGGSDSGPAFDNFASAWQAEAKTLEAALHELADKVRVSKANYQGADGYAVRGLNSAGAGDGLTTGAAPGARPAALGGPAVGTRPTPGAPPPGLADFD
ncbi:WXG100 family type VII secretion target [Streptomyces sp. WMMB 322]|uniref:WXG100 family type VII secretion target n=1 Tax=Streptomyces sp. WMMB 322 TaxID=1286821 RepID=UPI0006E2FB69|nr:WXG100 family type VII secretion target [Streptomyces sp. WMMB 322]SCK39788.1 Proteins of 100 residues with WXG [Streptomyces sp. WMMB 322]